MQTPQELHRLRQAETEKGEAFDEHAKELC